MAVWGDVVSTLTVNAKLVVVGVGAPPIYRHRVLMVLHTEGKESRVLGSQEEWTSTRQDGEMVLEPQAAFGLMLKLAEWKGVQIDRVQGIWLEWRGTHGWELGFSYRYPAPRVQERVEAMFWRVETEPPGPIYPLPNADTQCEPEEALKIIIEHIGMDHAIRRKLGFRPDPGTLWNVWASDELGWCFGDRPLAANLCADVDFTGITDPAEALRVIYEAVCGA